MNIKTVFLLLLLFTLQPSSSGQMGFINAPVIPNRAWTASSRPYEDVKAQIKREYAQGKSLASIAQEYKALAQAKPKDPVSQFAWICAGRGAALVSEPDGSMPRYLLETLTKSDPGNVREYTRYRFCLTDETDMILPVQNAEQIGSKLLKSNPKDDWVRLSLINMLCVAGGKGVKKALPHALSWVQLEPNNSKAHSSLALVYFDLWEQSGRKSKVLADKSVREYQTYLRLAPANDGFRWQAQKYIKYLQSQK